MSGLEKRTDTVTEALIYLASPYTHERPEVMERRFDMVCRKAGELMLQGHLIFCPIAHTHPIAVRYGLPRPFDFWKRYDFGMIRRCDEFWIYQIEGWEKSEGIKRVIAFALSQGLPVHEIPY